MFAKRAFENIFLFLLKFGRTKSQIFIYLHLQAMKSVVATKPFLIPLISATQILYDSLFSSTSDRRSKTGQRIAETKEVVAAKKGFIKAAQAVYKRAADKLGETSASFVELFPYGKATFNNLILENANLVMDSLLTGVKKYTVQLGDDMLTLISNSITDFNDARDLQSGLKSNVRENTPLYKKLFKKMIGQLEINRLTICLQDNVDPESNYFYYDESVLYVPSTHKGKDYHGPWMVGVQPDSQEDSKLSFAEGQKITLKNMSDINAYYFGALTATELMSPSCLFLLPGQEITITAEQLGAPGNKFLIFGNKDATSIIVVKVIIK